MLSVLVVERNESNLLLAFTELVQGACTVQKLSVLLGYCTGFYSLVCKAAGDFGYHLSDLHWRNLGIVRGLPQQVVFLDFEGMATQTIAARLRLAVKSWHKCWKDFNDRVQKAPECENWRSAKLTIMTQEETWWKSLQYDLPTPHQICARFQLMLRDLLHLCEVSHDAAAAQPCGLLPRLWSARL